MLLYLVTILLVYQPMVITPKTIIVSIPLKAQRGDREIISRTALGLKPKHCQLTGHVSKTSGGDNRMYFLCITPYVSNNLYSHLGE